MASSVPPLTPEMSALLPIHVLRALSHVFTVESPELAQYIGDLDDSFQSLYTFYAELWKTWRTYPQAMIEGLPERARIDAVALFRDVPEDVLVDVWTDSASRAQWPQAIASASS